MNCMIKRTYSLFYFSCNKLYFLRLQNLLRILLKTTILTLTSIVKTTNVSDFKGQVCFNVFSRNSIGIQRGV